MSWCSTIVEEGPDALREAVYACDVIFWDGVAYPSPWVLQTLQEMEFDGEKTLVIGSSVMTWANTKRFDAEEEPNGPDGGKEEEEEEEEEPEPPSVFSEEEFRLRKASHSFLPLIALEKAALDAPGARTRPGKLSTFVVAVGLMYGRGEEPFHHLFRLAWESNRKLPVVGHGFNFVPTIHVEDAANCLVTTALRHPANRYLLAIEPEISQLRAIVEAISVHLGTGEIQAKVDAGAFASTTEIEGTFINPTHLLMLEANIRFDPESLSLDPLVPWKWGRNDDGEVEGFVAQMPKVVAEYRDSRGLNAIKVVLLGPPSVGKSTLAKHLVAMYKAHHLTAASVIQHAIDAIKGDEDALAEMEDLKDEDGRYPDDVIVPWFRSAMNAMECRNRGFILDGFPTTQAQAEMLYALDDGEEEEESVLPDHVFVLCASDSFLTQRVMQLDQSIVDNTHFNEAGMKRRLEKYRLIDTDDDSVVRYFETAPSVQTHWIPASVPLQQLDIITERPSASLHHSFQDQVVPPAYLVPPPTAPLPSIVKAPEGGAAQASMIAARPDLMATAHELRETFYALATFDALFTTVSQAIGPPRHYGKSVIEIEAEAEKEKQEIAAEAFAASQRANQEEVEEELNRVALHAEWRVQVADVQRKVRQDLEVEAVPLQQFLMESVMPVLTPALIKVNQERPADPIDALAKLLFMSR